MAVPDPNNPDASKGKTSSAKKSKIPTYSAMVLEAVVNLNEREGSSLQAIRKYIMQHYDIRQAQTASFHNLTLKAVNKAVALNELEKFKHSFRLSQAEKDRRKEAEKRALQALQRSLMPPVRFVNTPLFIFYSCHPLIYLFDKIENIAKC